MSFSQSTKALLCLPCDCETATEAAIRQIKHWQSASNASYLGLDHVRACLRRADEISDAYMAVESLSKFPTA